MSQSYIRDYAERFKLSTDGKTCWDKNGEILIETVDMYIKYRNEHNEWRLCKQGDLFMCLFDDTPLHRTEQES